MKRFNLYLGNLRTSRAIQAELFNMGYRWGTSGTEQQDYVLGWVSIVPEKAVLFWEKHYEAEEITLFDLFSANEKLLITKPIKKMTVAEIAKALGHEVEIIK